MVRRHFAPWTAERPGVARPDHVIRPDIAPGDHDEQDGAEGGWQGARTWQSDELLWEVGWPLVNEDFADDVADALGEEEWCQRVFTGVGAGIAITGLACIALMAMGADSATAWLAVGAMAWSLHADRGIHDIKESVALFSAGLFVCCMFFHGELASMKPAPRYLTSFYLMVSLGGALGGVIVGFVAPRFFSTYYEFGAGLIVTLLLAVYVVRRKPFFVPETKRVSELLKEFQQQRVQSADPGRSESCWLRNVSPARGSRCAWWIGW